MKQRLVYKVLLPLDQLSRTEENLISKSNTPVERIHFSEIKKGDLIVLFDDGFGGLEEGTCIWQALSDSVYTGDLNLNVDMSLWEVDTDDVGTLDEPVASVTNSND